MPRPVLKNYILSLNTYAKEFIYVLKTYFVHSRISPIVISTKEYLPAIQSLKYFLTTFFCGKTKRNKKDSRNMKFARYISFCRAHIIYEEFTNSIATKAIKIMEKLNEKAISN